MKGLNGFLKLLVYVWLWEVSAILVVLSLYRMESEPTLVALVPHLSFKLILVAFILCACLSLLVHWSYSALAKEGRFPFRFLLKWNIVPLILMITIAEAALRLLSTNTSSETLLIDRPLGPRSLAAAAYFHRPNETLYSYDQSLGWIVRPNLRSSDGLYVTGDRGIRVSQTGTTMSAPRGACRIALVGDSHTFGEELKFEESWGYLLNDYLPPQCQILNFGVGGYGVGQMYLRYMQDVRPSHPDMVIFALSSHTAKRTMGVYGLNIFSSEVQLPCSKTWPSCQILWAQPRFELRDDEPVPINLLLPSLETITNAKSMSDLPYIDYDWFYVPGKWELPRWRYMYNSYLFRLYVTWFPLWRTQYSGNSMEVINHALLRSFLRTTQSDGATPVVLYLPDPYDYEKPHREMPSLRILRTSGFEYVDLRPCLDEIAAGDRFIPNGQHYALNGSTAIARCIAQSLPFKPS